jgi:hypothetical protein
MRKTPTEYQLGFFFASGQEQKDKIHKKIKKS